MNEAEEKLKSLYLDMADWNKVKVDDFIVTIGKLKSNSVYHIAEITRIVPNKLKRITRYYVKVFKSDLQIAIMRDKNQSIIPIRWYSRNKKK